MAANLTIQNGTRKRNKKPTVKDCRLMLVHNRLQGLCSNNSLFDSIGKATKRDLEQTLAKWGKECNEIVKSGYARIMKDFQSRYQEADVKQEENPRAVAKLLHAAKTARDILDGDMSQHLFECHKYENETEALSERKQREMRQRPVLE